MPRTLGLIPGWQWEPRGHCLFVQHPRTAAVEPVESDEIAKIVNAAKLATTIRFVIWGLREKAFPNRILLPGVSQDNSNKRLL
jgi:hypothetical protein